MKRLIPILLSLCLMLCACATPQETYTVPTDTAPIDPTEQNQLQIGQLNMTAVALPAIVETLADTQGNEIFTYTYQSINLVVTDPDVADKIILDFFARQDQHRVAAEAIHDMATESYTEGNWMPYLYSALYDPMRADENVLSLAGTTASWSGGNHPTYNCVFANYDMVTGDVMTLGSILTHKDKADDLCQLLLDAIELIREDSGIWSDYDVFIRDRFSADISYDSAWFFSAEGLCFRFPPYEIAPYASGIITVTIPYNQLTGIIEDAYFPLEQQAVQAQPQAAALSESNMDDFTQIAELVLSEDGKMVLIYTDSILYNVSIKSLSPNYTAFYTATVSPGDAIMVQGDFENNDLILEYYANNQICQKVIRVSADTVVLEEPEQA